MSTPRVPVPFSHVFTTDDLPAAGVTTGALTGWRARHEVVELNPGVFVIASADNLDAKRQLFASRAIATGRRPLTVLGAAVWHGLSTPPVEQSWWSNDDRHRSVTTHHLTKCGRLLVPSRAWTAVQLARAQRPEAALVSLDSALRLGTNRSALQQCADELRGDPHSRALPAAIAAADAAAESALESMSRGVITQAGMPTPALQQELRTRRGRFRVDFLWPDFGVIGEADGRVKYQDDGASTPSRSAGSRQDDALWREKLRQDALGELGFTVMRWTWHDITDGRADWLRRLGAHLRQPLPARAG